MRVVGKRAMSATHKSFRHRSFILGGTHVICFLQNLDFQREYEKDI